MWKQFFFLSKNKHIFGIKILSYVLSSYITSENDEAVRFLFDPALATEWRPKNVDAVTAWVYSSLSGWVLKHSLLYFKGHSLNSFECLVMIIKE